MHSPAPAEARHFLKGMRVLILGIDAYLGWPDSRDGTLTDALGGVLGINVDMYGQQALVIDNAAIMSVNIVHSASGGARWRSAWLASG